MYAVIDVAAPLLWIGGGAFIASAVRNAYGIIRHWKKVSP